MNILLRRLLHHSVQWQLTPNINWYLQVKNWAKSVLDHTLILVLDYPVLLLENVQ